MHQRQVVLGREVGGELPTHQAPTTIDHQPCGADGKIFVFGSHRADLLP
jgi:hypothetical protein